MDQHTKENWSKIKDHLSSLGMTDSPFYKRAIAICADKPDPMEPPSFPSVTEDE